MEKKEGGENVFLTEEGLEIFCPGYPSRAFGNGQRPILQGSVSSLCGAHQSLGSTLS